MKNDNFDAEHASSFGLAIALLLACTNYLERRDPEVRECWAERAVHNANILTGPLPAFVVCPAVATRRGFLRLVVK